MPFIRIASLPFEQPVDIASVVRAVNRDLAAATQIELTHLHTTWEFIPAGHYAKGDASPDTQPELNHPLIVELITPDFTDATTLTTMLETIAGSIAAHASFPRENIFIHHRGARSGHVFDDGRVVSW